MGIVIYILAEMDGRNVEDMWFQQDDDNNVFYRQKTLVSNVFQESPYQLALFLVRFNILRFISI